MKNQLETKTAIGTPPGIATRTYYVTFLNGEVEEVVGVRNLHLTGQKVILQREGMKPAVFGRAVVYSVVCDHCGQPTPC